MKQSRKRTKNEDSKFSLDQNRENLIILSFMIVSIICIFYIFNTSHGLFSDGSNNESGTEFGDPKDYIGIPLTQLNDGELHYYKTSDVKFYAYKAISGKIITRNSYCDPCSSTTFTIKKNGDVIDCDACNTQWDSESIDGIYPTQNENRVGGCEENPPEYITNHVFDDYLILKKDDLKQNQN